MLPTKRPTVVTLAGALLIAAAVILVVRSLIGLPYLADAADAARAAYAGSTDPNVTGDRIATVIKVSAIGGLAVSVLLAIGFVVLGMLDLRGNNVGRILTWIFGGIGVLCCGIGSAVGGATNGRTMGTSSDVGGVDTKAATEQINNAYPGWYVPTTAALTAIMTVLLLVTIILLMLPASNQYFRRDKDVPFVPPTAEPPYPTMPS
jgi:hypothetical protein